MRAHSLFSVALFVRVLNRQMSYKLVLLTGCQVSLLADIMVSLWVKYFQEWTNGAL